MSGPIWSEPRGLADEVRPHVLEVVIDAHEDLGEEAEQRHLEADEEAEDGDLEEGLVLHEDAEVELLVEGPGAEGDAEQAHQDSPSAEEVDGLAEEAVHELDGHEVEQDLEGAGDAVLGDARCPGAVIDGDFGDPRAEEAGESGNETVHLTVQP